MGRSPGTEFSVQVSRRRWRFVVDPHLCLGQDGAAFICGLTSSAEIWLGPEFLNILDSWHLYDRKPGLLMPGGHHKADDIQHALYIWLRLRDEAGLGGRRLFWVRDAVRESCLPADIDDSVVPRWEAMAEALDERLSKAAEPSGPMVAAMRDAAALTGLLSGAVLLTLCDPAEPAAAPVLCRHLQAWNLSCRHLDLKDDLVARERSLIVQLIIESGLCGFLWGGLRLAIVHVVVPGHYRLPLDHGLAGPGDEPEFLGESEPRPIKGVWEGARAFWYHLAAEG
ncbi:MAG: hypothetical protein WCC64_22185 [Aliidongia sp.]